MRHSIRSLSLAAMLLQATCLPAQSTSTALLEEHRDRQEAEMSSRLATDQARLFQRHMEASHQQGLNRATMQMLEQQRSEQRAAMAQQHRFELEQARAELNYELSVLENEIRRVDAESSRQAEAYGQQQQQRRSERRARVQQMFGAQQQQAQAQQTKPSSPRLPKAERGNPAPRSQQQAQQITQIKNKLSTGTNQAVDESGRLHKSRTNVGDTPEVASALAGIGQEPNDRCAEIQGKIRELIGRDKRVNGNTGTHGLANRFPEQDNGLHGPGTKVHDGHQEVIKNLQQGVRRLLGSLPDDCDPPPGAWTWAYRTLPSKETYRGPSSLATTPAQSLQARQRSSILAPSAMCQTLGASAAIATGTAACLTAGTAGGLACAPAGGLPAIPCAVASCSSAAMFSAAATGLMTAQFCSAIENLIGK